MFKITKSVNPMDYKDRMIELQNMYAEVADKLTISKLERDILRATTEFIKDKAFRLTSTAGTVEERKTQARVDIKVDVTYVKNGEEIKEKLTYHECKYRLMEAESHAGSMYLNLEELKSAISVCQMYPTRGV